MSPQFDIPQLRYIELPPRHPHTNVLCNFDDSTTPVYPRNSYDVPTPPGHDPDSSWWPDGLNELDPRPRNLLENCRKAIVAGPRNRFWHCLARLPDDEPRGEPSNIREYMYQRRRQEIRREKAKEAVADAVSKAVEANKEKARKATMDQEAKKEFKKRQKANFYLQHGLASCKFPSRFKDLMLDDFKATDAEIAEKKFLRPWTTSPPVSTRRATVCYFPPDPGEVWKESLKKKKKEKDEHDAAIKLYLMWEESPLGVPDGEGSEGKMWEEFMRQARKGE
ncbi:hypothetical protein AC579_6173 [Pseudocercospora musae]|uniref:Uncharacterized protein n=1 Tax=Pseudocercospora musae TaxID=113226 RepID=A0A139ISI1_9PEZI|nr:hypothetical protein AC579_6173 [Pseudocercospora musae]